MLNGFLLESVLVPLFEVVDESLFLVIDGLLGELGLLLQFLQLTEGGSVLSFEIFELTELLQLLLVDHLSCFSSWLIKRILMRSEPWIHLLSHRVSVLLFVLSVEESLDLVNR